MTHAEVKLRMLAYGLAAAIAAIALIAIAGPDRSDESQAAAAIAAQHARIPEPAERIDAARECNLAAGTTTECQFQ
jgi:hypothetical protein